MNMKDLLLCYENIESNDNCLKRKGKVGVMIVAAPEFCSKVILQS